MKIVDRSAFLALPAGTVFSKYEPCVFGPLEIKGDTWDHCNDFLSQQIADAIAWSSFTQGLAASYFAWRVGKKWARWVAAEVAQEEVARERCAS